MIWIKRTYPRFCVEWGAEQDRLSELAEALAASGSDDYRQMTMLLVEGDGASQTADVYIELPSETYASLFPDYQSAKEIPRRATNLLYAVETDRVLNSFEFPRY